MLYAFQTDVSMYNDGYLHFIDKAKTIILEHDEELNEEKLKEFYNAAFDKAKKSYNDPYGEDNWRVTEHNLIQELINFGFRVPDIKASIYIPKTTAGSFDHGSDETLKKLK
jgi:hypothetical protein